MHYFSDGCAGQYKNCKNFLNLCLHYGDFRVKCEWNIFATSHGKSPCNGIGRTVKRLVKRASPQRPISNQILTADKMFDQYHAVKFDFNIVHLLGPGDPLSPCQFVVCLCDRQYWVGIIMKVSTENLDVKVKFIHHKLPTPSLKWPSRDDLVKKIKIAILNPYLNEIARLFLFTSKISPLVLLL